MMTRKINFGFKDCGDKTNVINYCINMVLDLFVRKIIIDSITKLLGGGFVMLQGEETSLKLPNGVDSVMLYREKNFVYQDEESFIRLHRKMICSYHFAGVRTCCIY